MQGSCVAREGGWQGSGSYVTAGSGHADAHRCCFGRALLARRQSGVARVGGARCSEQVLSARVRLRVSLHRASSLSVRG